ncbi:MAG TPA: insulinase family protein [Marinospirillum sp.]|uniref:insulinase family protein n=1 Tax=Marinospirillum sp. TaxID=2183934 RepID=UPI002B48672F|nr:insulinase family protein [Marinospirillum sp.]HKM16279.1 insulinase family protein [Marinospirillum sp.]
MSKPAITANQPIISPNDQNDYLNFQLTNGLKVLVISDPTADKAAASMNIAAGSYHEPDAWPGLAHFLEHMLFLGTERFPEPDAYQNFISQHGGSHNAFTSARDTNYFFDVQPNHLEASLERLAQFFIAPLLSPEYLEREVNAVHSEWSGTLQDDSRLRLTALRQAFNPDHPASRFSAGNKESLDISNNTIRQALLDYYQIYYTTDRMTLVVLGKQPVNELRGMIETHFSAIKESRATPEPNWPSLFTEEQLPAQVDYLPLRQQRQLQLLFPIKDQTANYRKKADRYLGGLIGHEGEGSLLAVLKEKNWATSLSSGTQMNTGSEALFSINIELTPAGDAHQAEILTLVFNHINLIKQQGVEAWRYQEDAQLAANAFRYSEKSKASSLVTHLAMNLANYPAQDVLRAPYAFDVFDPALIQSLLDQLTPERLLIVRTSPEVKANLTGQWLPAHFSLSKPTITINTATTTTRLPLANSYLPSNLALKEGKSAKQPKALIQEQGMEIWQGLDTSFEVPRARLYISLQNPQVTKNLKQRLLARLAASWLNDQLNASAYPARLAGLNYDIYPHARGITLALGGFNAEQPRLIEQMLQALQAAQVNGQQFARLQQRLKQNLQNQQKDRLVQQLIRKLSDDAIEPGSWTLEEQLTVLEKLSSADLSNFLTHFTEQLYVQIMAWGNITPEETLALGEQVKRQLQPTLNAADVDLIKIKQIPLGQWQSKLNLDHNDRALLFYIQAKDQSLTEEAKLSLLNQTQAAAFFHNLRTQQQLGYAVFSSTLPLMQQPGIFYYVQSPQNEPEYLAAAIETFLLEDKQRLEQLSTADFQQHQRSLMNNLLQEDQRLGERAERLWREVGNQRQDFDRREQLAKAIKQLSQQDLLNFYDEVMSRQRGFYLLGTTPVQSNQPLPGAAAKTKEWKIK